MGQTITSRLPDELNNDLEEIAAIEQLDKSSIVRRFLNQAINQWFIDTAIDRFQKNHVSLGEAVAFSRLTIWEFLEKLSNLKIALHYDAEEFQADLDTINELISHETKRDIR
jgi:predicted HTH domain antitoxin